MRMTDLCIEVSKHKKVKRPFFLKAVPDPERVQAWHTHMHVKFGGCAKPL